MTNEWKLNPGTGVNPVREGETLTGLRFRDGSETGAKHNGYLWGDAGNTTITHYQVSSPRVTEPATMSADEVLIRAREAAIELCRWPAAEVRGGDRDDYLIMKAIIAYERDRAKPLAEVAPHTAEDPDERAAYMVCAGLYRLGALAGFADWRASPLGRSVIAAIKRGRELERGE